MVRIPDLPLDDAFPQLAVVTDPEAMREILQSELPAYASGALQIEKIKISRFQYRPGKKCSVCYQLGIGGRSQGSQIFYGLIDAKGRGKARFERELRRSHFEPALGPPLHYLEPLDMVLWGFPNDPGMRRLHELFEPAQLRALLARHAGALGLAGVALPQGALRTRVAKYVPEGRCVLEHRLWQGPEPEGEPALHLYTKTYEGPTGERAFRAMQALWNSEGRRGGRLHMPEPLGFDSELSTLLQRPVPGLHALETLEESSLAELAPQIGELLASIHRSEIDGLEARLPRQDLEDLHKACAMLAHALPEPGQRAGALVRRLEASLADLEGLPATPLHGAFRLTQMLLVEGRLVLLDFDGLELGNPVSDAGSLCAHLLYQTVKERASLAQAREAIAGFCASYRRHAPWGLPQPALRWHTATALLSKHAKKCVKRAKKRTDEKVESILQLACDVLDQREPLA